MKLEKKNIDLEKKILLKWIVFCEGMNDSKKLKNYFFYFLKFIFN
jgi:5S rRNA maturation endonuclease (ribonuclease M5)